MRIVCIIIFFIPSFLPAQPAFDTFFIRKSLRFDFLLAGNDREVSVYPQQMKQEPYWAGSLNNLTDSFNYGTCKLQIFDIENDALIFSKGFSTLFQEWQTTPEAKNLNKAFYHCLIFPYPRKKVRLEIAVRQKMGNFKQIYQTVIDPDDSFIITEAPVIYETIDIEDNGSPHEKVDLVILAEGYDKDERNKFQEDARKVTEYLFEEEPFKTLRGHFNVKAVFTPSSESGTDFPGEGIYRNTFFNSSFYTFGIDRYLTTTDMKSIHDAAAPVPYDHIFVLVNTSRYGGGGIYNFLNICSADNDFTPQVFLHEFGHGFAGLGDEYYSSSVAYEGYYHLEIEPWEPNLTTLVDFDSKWHAFIHDSIPIPTPRKEKYLDIVGAFEGGGYQAKGIYSPYMECRMKNTSADEFCPVCVNAIKKTIKFYSE